MLFKMGKTKINNVNYPQGAILLDANKIYFMAYPMGTGEIAGGVVGGIVGSLIGAAIDKAKQKDVSKKDITQDPIYAMLPDNVKKKIKKYTTYEIVDKKDITDIKKNFFGYEFTVKGAIKHSYGGLIYKKAIGEFLQQNGYPLAAN